MIIFDLDGTLADCEHRRHFVDPSYKNDCVLWMSGTTKQEWVYSEGFPNFETRRKFKPNWTAFYEACSEDKPIEPVIDIYKRYFDTDIPIEIWSGRCESVKQKTLEWLYKNIDISYFRPREWFNDNLKMRPIGDNTPDEILKERWLDEAIAEGKKIDFVFDDRKKVINFWLRRGIFVFDVSQGKGDF